MWRSSASSKSPTPLPKLSTSDIQDARTTARGPLLHTPPLLTEALRNNPFRVRDVASVPTPTEEEPSENQINNDLRTFANLYPDVKIEVLRELLVRFDGESRLQICTEQLFRYKAEWARGRLLNPPRDLDEPIPIEEQFRSKGYITACKRLLLIEFKSLNRSVVDGVLAEVNQSYRKARPILQEVASKSWRATFTALFRKKRGLDELPSFLADKAKLDRGSYTTGDTELDQEVEALFFTKAREQLSESRAKIDLELANILNKWEAEEAHALFECQCCFDEVPFEQIATCTTNAHVLCHECVRRSLNEALFGQGWAQSINTSMGTLGCLASTDCTGHVPCSLLESVVLNARSGRETWAKFEQRLANDSLTKSNLPLTHCPFCSYAEVTHLDGHSGTPAIDWRFRVRLPELTALTIITILLLELLTPTLLFIIFITFLISPRTPKRYFHKSLQHLYNRQQTQIFTCRSPTCGKRSCLTCHKAWHDPHTCHEPLILSLRTTVEAARTAALKRTCPRCGTSFVKSSGCNKLTCVCGYAMCYLCRKNIGKVSTSNQPGVIPAPMNINQNQQPQLQAGADPDQAGALAAAGEGYRHFCEHFRPHPNTKCPQCDKCDLYKSEDEDAIVRRAGEAAERDWRRTHARELGAEDKGDVRGLVEAVAGFEGHGNGGSGEAFDIGDWVRGAWWKIQDGRWSLQACVDWGVERCVVIVDRR